MCFHFGLVCQYILPQLVFFPGYAMCADLQVCNVWKNQIAPRVVRPSGLTGRATRGGTSCIRVVRLPPPASVCGTVTRPAVH
jgi:hypothetical protein